jgi:hypothetical protein
VFNGVAVLCNDPDHVPDPEAAGVVDFEPRSSPPAVE